MPIFNSLGGGGGATPNLADVLAEGNDADGAAITGLADPTDDQDAATKKYVDDNAGAVGYPAGTKMYLALLTQTGTDAPVATVLVNTFGDPVVWSYNNVGDYIGTLVGAFTANKTSLPSQTYIDWENLASAVTIWGSADSVSVGTYDISSLPSISRANGILNNTTIQILVLP